MFQFDWLWAFLLIPLPLLAYYLLPRAKKEEAALQVPFYNRATQASSVHHSSRSTSSIINIVGLILIWLLLLSAVAKPQWMGEPVHIPSEGRDLMLAVDLSGSMEIADMIVDGRRIPRLLVVKYVVGQFIERRQNDRIGLIFFGSNAYLQAPLTFDHATVKQLLDEALLNMAGNATAIGDAIGLAVKKFIDWPDSQRILILITDGQNTAGEVLPPAAAEHARKVGLKIYTIGVGAGRRASRQLDEETLELVAKTTGGQYFRARNPKELEKIYEEIDKLEPVQQEDEVFRPVKALYYWPLSFAFILSMLLILLNSSFTKSKVSREQKA